MSRRRVVVTGWGTVTPHADDVDRLFDQVSEGVCAIDTITQFDPSHLPSTVAAEVKYDVDAPATVGPYPSTSGTMRCAVRAALWALADAGLETPADDDWRTRSRRAVQLSTGVGSTAMEAYGPTTLRAWGAPPDRAVRKPDMQAFRSLAVNDPASRTLEEWFCDFAAPALGVLFGADRIATAASACASGSHSLFDAVNTIRSGRADVVLTGGVCTPITRSMMPGFALLSALTTNQDPTTAARPFDADRDGFIMAEGASLLVLEDEAHARARGARIHGEILGVGIATDAHALTAPLATGRGMADAMKAALADASRTPADVSYVNAHGTSTPLNDAAETLAIKKALGEDVARRTPVSSTKSMFGHLIHAAGVTEALVCLQAIRRDVAPPTINFHTRDPKCDLDYVPNEAREVPVTTALNNSFGFGGQNVSVLLSGYEGSP